MERAGIEAPALDAELLLCAAMGCEREALLLARDRCLDAQQAARFDALVARRCQREPLAYITGEREFWSLPFLVTPATLIPRPASEALVEAALGLLGDTRHDWRLLDLGTGCGCLILSLLRELPSASGIATDISAESLAVAQRNADRLSLAERIEFREGDWGAALRPEDTGFDVILSNPPYISTTEFAGLMPEVRRYEPQVALLGGPDGLRAFCRILAETWDRLAPGGHILFEVGAGQAPCLARMLARRGARSIDSVRDLAGIERVVRARKGG